AWTAIVANADSTATVASGGATARVVRRAKSAMTAPANRHPATRSKNDEHEPRRGCPPSVLPPPQDLSVLRGQHAQDRLQGREAPAALHLGARQDRAEPHHGGIGEEAARAGDRDQALALSRAAPLRDPLTGGSVLRVEPRRRRNK